MPNIPTPWVEGEKIPDEHLRNIFRPPPGVPVSFYRSSLVIGSRGAGKTTLFRYQKLTHQGIALHISLAAEFACLTKQTAFGPLTFDIPQTMEPLLIGKATSVLALTIAERLLKKDIPITREEIGQCLPASLLAKNGSVDLNWVVEAKRTVATAPLQMFEGLSAARPLPAYISSLGEALLERNKPLLLLLDRGDTVQAASLVPVLELLDQSSHYTVLVAMRPGHAGRALSSIADVVAGDHYHVVHLGIAPRSQAWCEFLEEAIRAQIGKDLSSVPSETKAWITALSRDSLRSALELFARYLSVDINEGETQLSAAIDDLKENQMAAAQRTLQSYHPDFRDMVNKLRASAIEQAGTIGGPLVLTIKQEAPEFSFEPPSRANRFLDIALRSGALCMTENSRWVPGLRPTDLEIPPILVWRKGDSTWTPQAGVPIKVEVTEDSLLQKYGGPVKPPSIFVAYRMNFEESKKFRDELISAFMNHPDLARVKVVDGRTSAGDIWAPTIQKRIETAKAVVGDVTGMRPDVMFEIGFAFGLRKAVIPVVRSPDEHASLPRWLSATQLGYFGSQEGLIGIVGSVAKHLSDPEYLTVSKAPRAIPALAVWLRNLDWNAHVLEQFRTTATRAGLKPEVIPNLASEESIRRAAGATLLVASLDGTADDALVHYICGAIVAKPKAGTGRTLSRLILLLEQPGLDGGSLVADSLRRCDDNVHIVKQGEVKAETERFLKVYTAWATSDSHRKK